MRLIDRNNQKTSTNIVKLSLKSHICGEVTHETSVNRDTFSGENPKQLIQTQPQMSSSW